MKNEYQKWQYVLKQILVVEINVFHKIWYLILFHKKFKIVNSYFISIKNIHV